MLITAMKSKNPQKMKEAIKAGADPNGLYATPTSKELFTL